MRLSEGFICRPAVRPTGAALGPHHMPLTRTERAVQMAKPSPSMRSTEATGAEPHTGHWASWAGGPRSAGRARDAEALQ